MRVAPPPGQLIDVGSHRLHLHCQGAGDPAVVFDAALGASSLSWTYVLPEVASFARACAVDRAGFAWSDAGPLPRTTPRIVEELRTVLASARIPPPYVLVGHSFGGLTARLFLHQHPEDVAGLVLLDPAYPEDWTPPSPALGALVRRGAQLCRYGRLAARFGITGLVAWLARAGAPGGARVAAFLASRGALRRVDEEVMAPAAKLPADVRAIAQRFWTQAKFFEALGSQIESIGVSAAAIPGGPGIRRCATGRRLGRDEFGCGPARTAGAACGALYARAPRGRRGQRPLDSARSARRGGRGDPRGCRSYTPAGSNCSN